MQLGKCAISLFGLFLASATSFGATIHVPGDHATIQEAINAAAAHDTISVAAGTYVENIDFAGKAITLRSEQGVSVTVIDGARIGAVVTFENNEGPDSILDGFTLMNGRRTDGGGVYCFEASPTIRNSRILNNEAAAGKGGGLFIKHSAALLVDNEIFSNSAVYGGGGICLNKSTATLQRNRVHDNTSDNSSGGGLYCYASDDVIDHNMIHDNSAGHSGGGIYVILSAPSITNNTIEKNDAPFGGGIACEQSTPLIVSNGINDNTASTGGGVDCYDASPVIDNNNISRNTAGGSGGIYCGGASSPMITRNTIASNSADSCGGGINCGTDTVIASNMIYRNSAGSMGGGVYCHSGTPTIINNTITMNNALVSGGAIASWNASVTVTNSILWNNGAGDGAEIHLGNATYPSSLDISYSDLCGGQGAITIETACTLNWGPEMIDDDPGFVEPSRDDFHVAISSPCINAGNSAAQFFPASDFESDPRLFLDSADIGADEFHFHLYSIGDVTPGGTVSLRVAGGPGMPAIVAVSSGLQSPPFPTVYGDLHLALPVLKTFKRRIPADGILDISVPVPAAWPSGDSYPAQALVGGQGWPYSTLTNVMLLNVD